ncbi:TetR/AcrR family transcriptional regulator [Singulisphaera sp. PoT]|uniref:TetR/AcrR family transcriptional regulator n=1 Tax=Singulisphaera sp. PoT TaxID=3411797 RepID=UPI003BF4D7A7
MAGTLKFDYAAALEAATRLFWETGYSNTSLRDLLKQMKIGEGSFYNLFKSKKNAYIECLIYYNATVNGPRGGAVSAASTAAAGIRALFEAVLDCLDDPETPSRACLMASSITPEVLAEPELREYIQNQMSIFVRLIVGRMAADREAGLLPPSFDPEIVGPIIITYLQGLWRMALISYDRPQYERQIDAFLTGLGL